MKDYTINIWVTYSKQEEYDSYRLFDLDNNIYKLFNVSEYYPKLNKYFCEFVTLYHIYKNHIKSDLIGFCHYRRYLTLSTIDFNDVLKNNKIIYDSHKYISCGYYLDHESQKWPFCLQYDHVIYNTFLDFLKENNVPLEYDIDYYKKNSINMAGSHMFLSRYETFEYIMNIMLKYLNFLFPGWENDFNVIYNSNKPDRSLGHITEQLFGFLLYNVKYKNSVIEANIDRDNCVYILKDGSEEELKYVKYLYKDKIKEGCHCFYIITGNINTENWSHDRWNYLNIKYFYYYIEFIKSIDEIKDKNYQILI